MARRYVEPYAPSFNSILTTSTACFNIATGDVEDAPALDPLHNFKVIQKDGGVYIQGQEKDIKNGRRNLNIKCKPSTQDKVLIIGGYSSASCL